MNGILRCSRYAFGPNRLHYCGPDANSEIKAYIDEGASDPGLEKLLREFQTMYPYLRHIAESNGIADAFDDRVVEAYWLGNDLLEHVGKPLFYRHLLEDHRIKDKIGAKSFEMVAEKIGKGAVPHHSFHVFDIWKRTGHLEREHTLFSMDECRISSGKIIAIDGPKLTVETEPLELREGKLVLAPPIKKVIARRLESEYDIEQVKVGDIVSIHWSVPCEVITPAQASALRAYTVRHLRLANETL